ncbi:MAG: aconitate hydratase [Elusimicrobia bacterium]|nr:aconitate hydratase [Elusimicrobiota bacterium]
MNLTQKIISKHLVSGNMELGQEIAIKIDQTLTQDATGTMACLEFESMEVIKTKTKISVSYVDHNTLQTGFENADDHRFLQSIASKYGIIYSPAGNGICHQVHLERFGVPGDTLIGSDSHTPTAGGIGMLAFGAGGLDVATAMAGEAFYITMPKIVRVLLQGKLKNFVSAKDIILELLRRFTVRGGRGKIFEYTGSGVLTLSVPERATITNMGTELGATTSIFPSDRVTKEFLKMQKREKDYKAFEADRDASYDDEVVINLNTIEPLIALPHSPDNVCKVREVNDIEVNQVAIGSCTNSSLSDMMLVAKLLKGKRINPNVSLIISPGSRQVMTMLAKSGDLAAIIESGARILECSCGPCIGMGQAPASGAVSLRTFNRNFEGRSGTRDAKVYLCSPEVAVASALRGKITDPRDVFKTKPAISLPKTFLVDDGYFHLPSTSSGDVKIIRGPNIRSLPKFRPMADSIKAPVLIKLGDNISTDHILPAGAKILPLRSNLPAICEYTFSAIDKDFPRRAKEFGSGVIIAGENYGQGSSREHAALAPRYLGVEAVIAKSFARIHLANLINFGILPLTFQNYRDYDIIETGMTLDIPDAVYNIKESKEITVTIKENGKKFQAEYDLTPRQKEILFAGGLLNWVKNSKKLADSV